MELLWECGGISHHRMVRTADGWRSRELLERARVEARHLSSKRAREGGVRGGS